MDKPVESTNPPAHTLKGLTPEQSFRLGEAWGLARAQFQQLDQATERLRLRVDAVTAAKLECLIEHRALAAQIRELSDGSVVLEPA